MVIPEKHKSIIIEIVNNINRFDITFVGGITDYCHFNNHNYDNNMMLSDIDVRIKNIDILYQLENLFNVKSKLVYEGNGFTQYYLYLKNNIVIDVFHDNNNYDDIIVKLFGYDIIIESFDCRLHTLKRTINKDLRERPTNKIAFKYLKKLVYYNECQSNLHSTN